MIFIPRLTEPEANSRCYTRNVFAINNPMPNCTTYAWGRVLEMLGAYDEAYTGTPTIPYISRHDAIEWAYDVFNDVYGGGWKFGNMPKLGAVVVFGATEGNSKGHVAIVEAINGDNITISQSRFYAQINYQVETFNYKTEKPHGDILTFIYIAEWENENGGDGMKKDRANLYVRTTYIEVLGRDADADGLENYSNMIIDRDENDDLSDVDDSLRASDEYKRKFIVAAYNNLLGRVPENEEVINEKMNYARLRDITEDILNSDEYLNNH